MTNLPHLRFYVRRRTEEEKNQLIAELHVPSREEFEMLKGYEPTKLKLDYETYANIMTERMAEMERLYRTTDLTMCKVSCQNSTDPIIQETEKDPQFVRWYQSK